MNTQTESTATAPLVRRTGGWPVRILVTGSRHWRDRGRVVHNLMLVWEQLGRPDRPVLVTGACPTGADRMAEDVWEGYGWPVERYPAEWDLHGKAAGPIRNQLMVDRGADVCIAFPLPDSRGTTHCMAAAVAAGIPVLVVEPRP